MTTKIHQITKKQPQNDWKDVQKWLPKDTNNHKRPQTDKEMQNNHKKQQKKKKKMWRVNWEAQTCLRHEQPQKAAKATKTHKTTNDEAVSVCFLCRMVEVLLMSVEIIPNNKKWCTG